VHAVPFGATRLEPIFCHLSCDVRCVLPHALALQVAARAVAEVGAADDAGDAVAFTGTDLASLGGEDVDAHGRCGARMPLRTCCSWERARHSRDAAQCGAAEA
jgi:hypothetical protein